MDADNTQRELSEQLGRRLAEYGLMAATAESCTGGGVACAITDIAGSSAWFDRAFVTYSNDAKQQMLGVPADTLERFGAVSREVVEIMAREAVNRSRAQLAVAISGIAGPGGGSLEKPVGTVWFAWYAQDGELISRCECFSGDRTQVRQQAVNTALSGLLSCPLTRT